MKCFGDTSAVITVKDKILLFGDGEFGQLGIGHAASNVPIPISVPVIINFIHFILPDFGKGRY